MGIPKWISSIFCSALLATCVFKPPAKQIAVCQWFFLARHKIEPKNRFPAKASRFFFCPLLLTCPGFAAHTPHFLSSKRDLLLSGKIKSPLSARESVSAASAPLDLVASAWSFFRPCTFFVSRLSLTSTKNTRSCAYTWWGCLPSQSAPKKIQNGWNHPHVAARCENTTRLYTWHFCALPRSCIHKQHFGSAV